MRTALFLAVLPGVITLAASSSSAQNDWISIEQKRPTILVQPPQQPPVATEVSNVRPKPRPIKTAEPPANQDYKFVSHGRKLAGGDKGGYLDACGPIQIGVPCKSRHSQAQISEKFAAFVMKTLPVCIAAGLEDQGLGSYKKVVVKGITFQNRNVAGSRKLSLHATGRSLDLTRLEITLANGHAFNLNLTKAAHQAASTSKFYRTLVSCWRSKNESRPDCKENSGLYKQKGA